MGYDSKTRYEAVRAVRNGATLMQAESAMGVSRETVRRWCAAEGISFVRGCMGGAILPSTPPSGRGPGRLDLAQRLAIGMGIAAGRSHAEIARGIGFSWSTVSREVFRHREPDGAYDPCAAQRAARRPKAHKTDRSARLRAYVLEKLSLRWSPKQVSAKIREDFPDDEEMRVSHEAIYQALYVQGKGVLRQELKLEKALRNGRGNRLPRSRLATKRGKDMSWVEGCEISRRPPEVEDRAVRDTGRETSSWAPTTGAAWSR